MQMGDHLLRLVTVGALLSRANSLLARFISSCFQVLIIVG
jgi:hypothetical protein